MQCILEFFSGKLRAALHFDELLKEANVKTSQKRVYKDNLNCKLFFHTSRIFEAKKVFQTFLSWLFYFFPPRRVTIAAFHSQTFMTFHKKLCGFSSP